MKVIELEGLSLDLWVANAADLDINCLPCFSTDWAQCGPLIEEYEISLQPTLERLWLGTLVNEKTRLTPSCQQLGETPLIAACRCIVASVYGDEVPE